MPKTMPCGFIACRSAVCGGRRYTLFAARLAVTGTSRLLCAGAKNGCGSDRFGSGFACPDPNDLLYRLDKNLAVANLSGAGGFDHSVDDLFHSLVTYDDLDLHLWQKVDDIFGPAIQLGMAFLPAETLDFRHRQSRNADFCKRFAHFVELERFDDCGYLLHGDLLG
jgi:hypothetical protein